MDEREQILIQNYEEYYSFALDAYNKQKYNSATTLFFKALVSLCDLFLFRKEGQIPSSHTNRFRSLEKYPEVYEIVDRDFPFYQDSYTARMDKDIAELLKNDVEDVKSIVDKGN
ncbi:MAG: hypothetical protein PHU51_01925 [Candidatus Nanoarchaeia archaeon]|nr:hypothetical protein [Candidatus Nanoarchaeia archaeon]